ncbi:MAG: sensor histidine kinase [Chloroflexota bacterium]
MIASAPDARADEHRALRLAGIALPAAVWLLGMASPPRDGLTFEYVLTLTGLLAVLVLVDQRGLESTGGVWRKLAWYGLEIVLCFLVVRNHGTLIRPALIYLLPTSRALLLFGERPGLPLSFMVWIAYGINIVPSALPDRPGEFTNYFSFFLPLYVLALVLTLAIQRQSLANQQLRQLYDELRTAHDDLRMLHNQAREAAVAEERSRLAREIHDTIAHYLTVISVQLEAAEKLAERQADQARASVRMARKLTLDCLNEVRRSVGALRASSLDELTLPRALEKLVSDFRHATGLEVSLDIALGDGPDLPVTIRQALFRVAQEGLTNVQKHACATAATVRVHAGDDAVNLSVADDGTSRDIAQTETINGFGLIGLRERVALLGGQLDFGRNDERGSVLAVTIPIDQADHALSINR